MNNPENKKFIYVFNRQDADRLLSLGYKAIQEDDKKGLFVFLYEQMERHSFSAEPKMVYCLSNTLTF